MSLDCKDALANVDLLNDLVDALRMQVDLNGPRKELSGSCNETLGHIGTLWEPCNVASGDFDQLSVALVQASADEGDKPESEQPSEAKALTDKIIMYQKRHQAVKSQWNQIRKLLYCADVHLRNAAQFQQYYGDVKDIQKQLDDHNEFLNKVFDDDEVKCGSVQDIQNYVQELEELLKALKFWKATVVSLESQSRTVVPVEQRTESVCKDCPLTVRVLTSAKTPKVTVHEGETLTLVNNDDIKAWKVKNATGDEFDLPAVCCLIPPPDSAAIEAIIKLLSTLRDVYSIANQLYQNRLMVSCREILFDLLNEKSNLLENIRKNRQKYLLDMVTCIDEIVTKYCKKHRDFKQLKDMLEQYKAAIESANDQREEKVFGTEVYEITNWLQKFALKYECLAKENEGLLLFCRGILREEIVEEDEVDEGLDMNVQRESAVVGDASSMSSTAGEVSQKFSIKSIIDTSTGEEISMTDAVRRGIINQQRGIYRDAKTGEEIPIPVAMTRQLILVESTSTTKAQEKTHEVGVVTVTVTHENRPYTIKRVRDPRTEEYKEISVSEAMDAGIFDAKNGIWKNPATGEKMSVENAIDSGALVVEYKTDNGDEGSVTTSSKTFAVFACMDTKNKKMIPFYEASQRGLIDKESGIFTDAETGDKMQVVEAFKKGLIKAKVVEDPKEIEQYMGTSPSQH